MPFIFYNCPFRNYSSFQQKKAEFIWEMFLGSRQTRKSSNLRKNDSIFRAKLREKKNSEKNSLNSNRKHDCCVKVSEWYIVVLYCDRRILHLSPPFVSELLPFIT